MRRGQVRQVRAFGATRKRTTNYTPEQSVNTLDRQMPGDGPRPAMPVQGTRTIKTRNVMDFGRLQKTIPVQSKIRTPVLSEKDIALDEENIRQLKLQNQIEATRRAEKEAQRKQKALEKKAALDRARQEYEEQMMKRRQAQGQPDAVAKTSTGAEAGQKPTAVGEDDAEEEEDDYENEEFEDYDDEFDEEDEEDTKPSSSSSSSLAPSHKSARQTGVSTEAMRMHEIASIVKSENVRALSRRPSQSAASSATDSALSSSVKAAVDQGLGGKQLPERKFVSLGEETGTQEAPIVTQKRKMERLKEVQKVTKLSEVGISALELPPLTEVELYVRQLGHSIHQVQIQADPGLHMTESQTDDVFTESEGVQCGWTAVGNNVDRRAAGSLTEEVDGEVFLGRALGSFLARAGTVAESLVQHNVAAMMGSQGRRKGADTRAGILSGEQMVALDHALFRGSSVLGMQFSAADKSTLVTLHRPRDATLDRASAGVTSLPQATGFIKAALGPWAVPPASAALSGERVVVESPTCIGVWSLSARNKPDRILLDHGSVSCIGTCSHTRSVVLAGTQEGALLVYNMSEGSDMYIGGVGGLWPSYSTAGLRGASEEGAHPAGAEVVCVSAIGESTGEVNAFQFVSVDAAGELTIWAVTTVPREALLSVSETDLGLKPGSGLCVSKIMTIAHSKSFPPVLSHFLENETSTQQWTELGSFLQDRVAHASFSRQGGSDALLCFSSGAVRRVSRSDGLSQGASSVLPRLYSREPTSVAGCLSMDTCAFMPELMAVGYDDGFVAIFVEQLPAPIMLLSGPDVEKGSPCVELCFSAWFPGVFYSLAADGLISVWDITLYPECFLTRFETPASHTMASVESPLGALGLSTERNFVNDYAILHMAPSAWHERQEGNVPLPRMACALRDGGIQVYTVAPETIERQEKALGELRTVIGRMWASGVDD